MKETILLTVALLPFHFIADWAFQSYPEAMAKATNWKVRTWHVAWYTLVMWWGFVALELNFNLLLALGIFIPHWLIDTYKPVYWWVKTQQDDPHAETVEKFKESFQKPRQLLMYVVLDQLFHFLTLLPVVHYAWVAQ